jgi:benzodiazapine receptor
MTPPRGTATDWLVAFGLAFGVAAIGGGLTVLDDWYYSLEQPWFKPPDILFGPAWTILFILMAISGVLAWRTVAENEFSLRTRRAKLLMLWVLNGLANIGWSLLYFFLQRPDWALAEVVLLLLSIVLLIRHTRHYNKRAAMFLWPYLAWVSFAAVLNLATVVLNSPFG